jgi:hypothetical protein
VGGVILQAIQPSHLKTLLQFGNQESSNLAGTAGDEDILDWKRAAHA